MIREPFTPAEIHELAYRIANGARAALEASDQGWAYLPSFADAVTAEAERMLTTALQHERRLAVHGASEAER